MNRTIAAFLLSLLISLPLFAAGKDDIPLAPAVECTPRAGLPNFFAKITVANAELKIAYLGGSITEQQGWRPKTLSWLQQNNPSAKLSEINAAIGGTGSDLGVFRLQQDVLDHRPDLLFVEFAVNDGGASPESIYRCMEGIVRQTWRAYPGCDICFVYTLVEGFVPTLQEGKFPRAASAMEKVAEHYGIPSIHMGIEVAQLAKEGKLILKGKRPDTAAEKAELGDKILFSPDGVHPFPETGHELYLKAIARSWPKIQAASGKAADHVLPPPLDTGNYEQAKLIAIDKATLSPGFTRLDPKEGIARNFHSRSPSLYRADKPGETITFKFKGTYCAIYDVIGPDCGQVVVTVDDQPPVTRARFDSFSTYYRLATLVVGSDLADVVHSVKLEIHPNQPDKVKILAQRQEKMDKPERFNGTAFYPAAILVAGDLSN